MTILNMPDAADEQAAWLDQQLVGSELATIVAELSAVHGSAAIPLSSISAEHARAWLGAAAESVLAGGLRGLPRERIAEALQTPLLLLSLQELVLIEGGDYWDGLLPDSTTTVGLPDALRLAATAPTAAAPEKAEADLSPTPKPRSAAAPQTSRRMLSLAAVAALAAAVLLAVGTWTASKPEPWGWNRPDALADADADLYLEQLAGFAEEWEAESPASEAALRTRLEQLIAGCDRLISAPHRPLDVRDKQWLVEKCQAWREKLAEQVVALDTSHDAPAVQTAVDEIVAKLSIALRTRAGEVRSRPA